MGFFFYLERNRLIQILFVIIVEMLFFWEMEVMESIRRYLQFVKPYRGKIFLTMIIGILKFGIPLLLPLLLKYAVDDLILSSIPIQEKMKKLTWVTVGILLIFTVIRYPIEYFRQYFAQWTGNKILFDIRNRLFTHLQKLSLNYYHNQKLGQIISRVINDVEQTKEFVITGMMNIWLDMMTLLIAFSIMLWINPVMSLVSIAIFPLYIISVKFFYKNMKMSTKARSQALAELQGHLHERIQGISVIRSFHLEEREEEKFRKKNSYFLNRAVTHTKWVARTFAAINTITDLAPIIVIVVSCYQVLQGNMTVGAMTAFYGYMGLVYNPVRRLVNSSTILTQAHASMDRVFEFLDQPYEIQDKRNAEELTNSQGDIRFQNVYFRYKEDQNWVLKNINLQIRPNQTVALVGPSGGGKSTLISLIPRFYDVTHGKIFIDGQDLHSLTMFSLRKQIGLVLQENFLFSGTVTENILMGNPDATMKEVQKAAVDANAHEFIMDLPNGYQTEIGERGVKLSGGQKQRLALARVFLKNPSILILDEATSALDLQSEHFVQEALDRLKDNRTTIIIAHRLSTITHADQIIYIDQGQVKEQGTHLELMDQNGMYAHLFRVQNLSTSEAGYR